jgi:iron(III) transport system permease protein
MLGRARWIVKTVALALIFLTCALPVVGLAVVSFERYWVGSLSDVDWTVGNYGSIIGAQFLTLTALKNSIVFGVIAAAMAVVAATAGVVISNRRGARLPLLAAKVPAGIPHLILAIGLVGSLEAAPVRLSGAWLLVIGYFIIYLPFCAVVVDAAAKRVPTDMLSAARLAGATEWQALRDVMLPLIRPALLVGWALMFVLVMGDLVASVLLSGVQTPVIGFVMVDILETGVFPQDAALGVILSLVTGGVVLAALRFGRHGITHLGR